MHWVKTYDMITFIFVGKVVKGMKIGANTGAGSAIHNRSGYAFGLDFSGHYYALSARFRNKLTAIYARPKGQFVHFTNKFCFECLSPHVAAA